VHTHGWPQNERTLDDADTIVIYSDGAMRGHQHPLVRDNHMPALEKQMRRGCGLVVIHFGLMLPAKIGNKTFLEWIGGFKDYENPPRPIGEPLRIQDWSKQASHPICRGVKPFEMPKDEKYKTPERLLSDDPGFTPILPFPGKPGDPVWAWAWQRKDGGRGFGFSGGHYHAVWENDNLRKVLLNAILWTANKAVPDDGSISSLPPPLKTPPEPVFLPIKIDGPAHNPAVGSYWYGPFNESCSLVDVNGDGQVDITNRAAFQILLAKLRLPSTFFRLRLLSLPGVEPTNRVKRSASVPRSSMTINGSITFPLVLLIFWPFSSRMRP
jgi:trehalose utilization protein